MKNLYIFIVVCLLLLSYNTAFSDTNTSKFDFKLSSAFKQGYENNVFLDSSRKGDGFTESAIYAEAAYKLAGDFNIGLQYDFFLLNYHRFTDFNLVDNEARAFFKYEPRDKKFNIRAGYLADFVWYEHDKNGTYYALGPWADFMYYLNKDLFVKGEYEFKTLEYDKKRIRDNVGKRLFSDRRDYKHTTRLEAGYYIKDLLIRVEETLDFNDSNDEYVDFYDYFAYKTTIFASMPVFKVIYLTTYGSYRVKDFDSRQIATLNATEKQKTMTLGGRAYYNIYKSAYLSGGYTYIQNYSNQPSNRYSDSISSVGVHIFF